MIGSEMSTSEKSFVISFLTLVSVLTTVDVISDLAEGSSIEHITVEVLIVVVGALGILFLLRSSISKYKVALNRSAEDLTRLQLESQKWKKESESLLRGLSDQIARQFHDWKFTPAEQEVSLLLIKGFSSKEIANLRGVHETTVRQQCSTIYRKSGLSGRAELAAFFLEDLLLPQEP
jgi:DNA-binding CsgD family transcriptional regulator